MPTIGNFEYFFSDTACAVFFAGLERADFLRLGVVRELDALFLFDWRFAPIALFRLIAAAKPYKLVVGALWKKAALHK